MNNGSDMILDCAIIDLINRSVISSSSVVHVNSWVILVSIHNGWNFWSHQISVTLGPSWLYMQRYAYKPFYSFSTCMFEIGSVERYFMMVLMQFTKVFPLQKMIYSFISLISGVISIVSYRTGMGVCLVVFTFCAPISGPNIFPDMLKSLTVTGQSLIMFLGKTCLKFSMVGHTTWW